MSEISDWNPTQPGNTSDTYQDFLNRNNRPAPPPVTLSATQKPDKSGIIVSALVKNPVSSYSLYFIPFSLLTVEKSTDVLYVGLTASNLDVIQSWVSDVNSPVSSFTYTDIDHLEVKGWWVVLGQNMNASRQAPISVSVPAWNPILDSKDYDIWVVPANPPSAAVTKSSVTEPGACAPDTIWSFSVYPSVTPSFIGYQIVLYNYASDGAYRESVFLSGQANSALPITGSMRLPTDAVGHTNTFYFVPVAVSGRRQTIAASYSVGIASG